MIYYTVHVYLDVLVWQLDLLETPGFGLDMQFDVPFTSVADNNALIIEVLLRTFRPLVYPSVNNGTVPDFFF